MVAAAGSSASSQGAASGETYPMSEYRLPRDWHAATDDGRLGGGAMHDADARLYSGSGSRPIRESDSAVSLRRCSTARLRSHAGKGLRTFLAYSRLPMYSLHASDTPEQYVSRTVQRDGVVKPLDFGFRLHWAAGAKPLRSAGGRSRYIVIPGSMPDDAESLSCGVLVITPLADRSVFPFEAAIAA